MNYTLHNGNSAEILKQYPDNHFDSIITDPPYGISFLGKDWDKNTGEKEVYEECLRVLKPGGHILAFSAARTYHHLAMTLEEVGFEIRDQIMWIYSSGFPKSHDVGRNIDRSKGLKGKKGPLKRGGERMISQTDENGNRDNSNGVWANETKREPHIILPESDDAKQWSGWGTALKPAHEPICMARKPMKDSVVKNVQIWGTGAINIDACRVSTTPDDVFGGGAKASSGAFVQGYEYDGFVTGSELGRFPANVIHDGSEEVVNLFPHSKSGARKSTHKIKGLDTGEQRAIFGDKAKSGKYNVQSFTDAEADEGSASRFFYCPKVSRKERHAGFDLTTIPMDNPTSNGNYMNTSTHPTQLKKEGNNHPTVKPVELMKYLIKLITPKNGKVLDPFNGSGSTGMACVSLGHHYTGIDLDEKYIEISRKRIEAYNSDKNTFDNLFDEE